MSAYAEHAETARRGRPRRERGRPTIALNLTAMIDCVFLLLVYFMVATEFKVGEEIYRLDLPERGVALAAPDDPFELDDEPVRIRVASVGSGGSEYTLRLEGPFPHQVDTFDALFRFLRDRQINAETVGGLFPTDHPIIVAPARRTTWEHAVEAFNAAVRARYTDVTFAPAR